MSPSSPPHWDHTVRQFLDGTPARCETPHTCRLRSYPSPNALCLAGNPGIAAALDAPPQLISSLPSSSLSSSCPLVSLIPDVAEKVPRMLLGGRSYFIQPGGIALAVLIHRGRSEEHTSELQSHSNLVCRLLL